MRAYKLYLLNSHRDRLSHGQLGGDRLSHGQLGGDRLSHGQLGGDRLSHGQLGGDRLGGDRLSHGQLGGVWIIWCRRDRTNHIPYDWRADLVAFAPLDRDTASNNTDAAQMMDRRC